jgi:hypothetical protein
VRGGEGGYDIKNDMCDFGHLSAKPDTGAPYCTNQEGGGAPS